MAWADYEGFEDAAATWTARAIVERDCDRHTGVESFSFSILPDRQGFEDGGNDEDRTALLNWLNNVALPKLRAAVELQSPNHARRGDQRIWTRKNRDLISMQLVLTDFRSGEVVGIDEGEFHLRASPKASYGGYIYIGAYYQKAALVSAGGK